MDNVYATDIVVIFIKKKYICSIRLNEYKDMAISIKSVPTLTGKNAERFVVNTNKAIEKRATVNFSKQVKSCASILSKAKI